MVADRVGDYVHCMTRLVNAAYRRVAGDVCEPTVRALLRDTLVEVAQAARALPAAERIGPASSRQRQPGHHHCGVSRPDGGTTCTHWGHPALVGPSPSRVWPWSTSLPRRCTPHPEHLAPAARPLEPASMIYRRGFGSPFGGCNGPWQAVECTALVSDPMAALDHSRPAHGVWQHYQLFNFVTWWVEHTSEEPQRNRSYPPWSTNQSTVKEGEGVWLA